MAKKLLDNNGLAYFWGKLKAYFYKKPSAGIPKTDLATDVQSSLDKVVSTTYADLATMKSGGTLVQGMQYRITDYCTMTKSSTIFRSANHPFDIIVTATSGSTLDEEANAILHEGDTYFANAKLQVWRIWYCFDNDTARFAWVDSSCKGAIYRMIDEWDNDVPYDFKNIQFSRKIVTAKSDYPQLAILNGMYIGLTSTGNSTGLTNGSASKWYYTFSRLGETWAEDVTDESTFGTGAWGNRICRHNDYDDARILNNIVCANGQVLQDFFDTYYPNQSNPLTEVSVNCIYELKTGYQSLFGCNAYVRCKGPYRYNTILGINRHNTFSSDFENNTIVCCCDNSFNTTDEGFFENVIVSYGNINANSILNSCGYNVLVNTTTSSNTGNIVASVVRYNNFYGYSNRCNYIGYVHHNTFGASGAEIPVSNCNFDDQISYCSFASKLVSVNIRNIAGYLSIPAVTDKTVHSVDIIGSIKGGENDLLVLDAPVMYVADGSTDGQTRRVRIEKSGSDVVATWVGENGLEGLRKVSGTNTWIPFNTVQGNGKVFYGTCSTAGATAAKVVTCDSFTSADLAPGTLIIVKFDNANTAAVADITMSVNGTTACNIRKLDGTSITTLSAAGEIRAFPTLFICTGTYWIQANTDRDTTYATIVDSEINTGTGTGKRVVSAKVLRDNFYTESEINTMMGGRKIWAGTQAEYDLLTPDADTLYFITESSSSS